MQQKAFEFPVEQNPFDIHIVLINLNSSEVASESVHIFQAQVIRESLIQGIAGTSEFGNKFRKKDIAITIKTYSSVSIEDSVVEVDPQLFFQ